ncbi:amidase [Cutibacterium equinum]|uniref:Amidase n=1 Tax=Cutibacterium equinum TaxID=3016342 RepID=A0ABY7R2G1_9ACTN|nr:amidase [Cutibacterium equinum]WCC81109.1 amidase [Cutibacterium equinum]
MPDQVADSARATGFGDVDALGGVDLLLERVDVFLLLPFERVPEPRDDVFAVVCRGRAGEDARVAMSWTLSTTTTSSPEAKRRVR